MTGFTETGTSQDVTGTYSLAIKPITDQNIDACVSAYMKAYNCPPWNYRWPYDKAKQYLLEYMDCAQFVGFALYDQGEIIAAAFAHTKTWWTGNQLMIDEFFVSQERQGRGYGKRLLAHCDRYCAENQVGSVILMTSKYMPSYNFYEKNGYTTIDPFVFLFKQVSAE